MNTKCFHQEPVLREQAENQESKRKPGIPLRIPGFSYGGEGGICRPRLCRDMERMASSRHPASVHRTDAWNRSNPAYDPNLQKEEIPFGISSFMAEKEGFEPSIPFWGIHDFQSCALGQLRDFSKFIGGHCQPGYNTTFFFICQESFFLFSKRLLSPQGHGIVTLIPAWDDLDIPQIFSMRWLFEKAAFHVEAI